MIKEYEHWKYPEKIGQLVKEYHLGGCSIIDHVCDDQYTKSHLRADLIEVISILKIDFDYNYSFSEIIHCCVLPRKEFNLLEGLEKSYIQNKDWYRRWMTMYNIIHLFGTETKLWQDESFRDRYKLSGPHFRWEVIPDDQLHHFSKEIVAYIYKEKSASFRKNNGIDAMSMDERVDFMWQHDRGHRKYRRTLGKDGWYEDFSNQDIADIYLAMKAKKSENPERYRLFANIFLHDVDMRMRKLGESLLNESPKISQRLF